MLQYCIFIWNGVCHEGYMTQEPSEILGLKTNVDVTRLNGQSIYGMKMSMYGKFEVGDCGPYKVIHIAIVPELSLEEMSQL